MFTIKEILKATEGKLLRGSSDLRIKAVSTDSRKISKGELFIALKGSNFDGHNFIPQAVKLGAKAVLIEQGNLANNPQLLDRLGKTLCCIIVKDNLKALGDIASDHRAKFSFPVIAVTGSSGKTTVKEMIAQVLSSRYRVLKAIGTENNLVGVPQNLLKLNNNFQIACLELGTNSFGEIARLTSIVKPNVGIITNIGQAHLEGLINRQGVFKEKKALLAGLIAPAIGLVNDDDEYLRSLDDKHKYIFGFAKEKPCDFFAQEIVFDKQCLRFKLSGSKQVFSIKSLGIHNVYNALAAIAVGVIFGIDQKSIAKKLNAFKFPKSRFNLINQGQISIIDDTYNSNPLSLTNAIESVAAMKKNRKKILVLADMLELGKESLSLHRQAGELISTKDFDFLLTFGKLSRLIIDSALKCGFDKRNVYISQDILKLKRKLFSLLEKGDIILVKGSRRMRLERIVNFLTKKIKLGKD
jgi:UDP-N-acetylmuramoyl-tripeptide--D-alanyl-D-alanine ligase